MSIHESIPGKKLKQLSSGLMPIDSVAPVLAPYRSFRCTSSQTSWFSATNIPPAFAAENREWNPAAMLDNFSYCVAGGDYFPPANFDLSNTRELLAERYGGRGVGGNGGGARCGMLQGVQIKGSGGNCLVGQNVDWWHTTGCLQLTDAVVESIYAGILQTVLPAGAARCYGIIDTGLPAPYYLGDRSKILIGRGSLMLREALLRPAHFLRSPHFVASTDRRPLLASDTLRVKQAIAHLHAHAQQHGGIEALLINSLVANARQFAVARLERVTHSTITPSNLSFGGEWLDLTTCSLIPAGANCKFGTNQPSFYLESLMVPQAYEELVDTYNKYTGSKVNFAALAAYYQQAFLRSGYLESPRIFGLQPYVLKPAYQQLYQPLAEYLHQLIGSDKGIRSGYPYQREHDDPLHIVLKNLYLSLRDERLIVEDELRKLPVPFPAQLIKNFRSLMQIGFQRYANGAADFHTYCKRAVIQLFRREFLRDLGYRNRVNDALQPLVDAGTINFQEFIDFHHQGFQFAYNNLDDEVVGILALDNLSIDFCCKKNHYRVVHAGKEIYVTSIASLRTMLTDFEYGQLCKCNYDFNPYLQDLCAILQHFE